VKVIVVYVLADRQRVLRAEVAPGTTIGEAIVASGLLVLEPELQHRTLDVGVWNRRASASEAAREGDRIEVYRPLTVDPKEARRIRAGVRKRRRAASG
jgi:putative ubiquitin-RnfH superfamily antitoxin RatB of RatAB toxin-antitoxin module